MEQTPMKKRKRQALETKERIFNATISLIKERGFNHVLMEDITQRAGVSAGLFYNYFASKADVLTESFYYRSSKYYESMEQEWLADVKGLEKLRQIIHHVAVLRLEIYEKEELRQHHINLLTMRDRLEDVRENSGKLFEMITESLSEAKEEGELPDNTDLTALRNTILLVLRGATWEYLGTSDSYPFEERSWDIISKYIKGL